MLLLCLPLMYNHTMKCETIDNDAHAFHMGKQMLGYCREAEELN